MKLCQCCGEEKPTRLFSWNTKVKGYSPNCRDCGNWLTLLRAAFGKTRDVEANREKCRLRKLVNKPAVHLQEVWGIRRAA